MTKPRSQKQERDQLVRSLRASGTSWVDVATVLQECFRLNARVAFRYAHGWSQRRAADEWNKRWPDELKTFKNFSYWESWPGSTGHAPSFDNLSKLAELYECAVSDLVSGLADFRHLDEASGAGKQETVRQTDAPVELPGSPSTALLAEGLRLSDNAAVLLLPYLADINAVVGNDFAPPRDREIGYDRLVQLLSEWAHTMRRRRLLRSLGWAASAVAAMPLLEGLPPEEQIRVTQAIETPSRIDTTTLDHIEAVLWRCIRQDDALGAQATLDTVCAQRNLVRLILPECPDELRPRLLSLYSNYSLQAGWLFYDLNDFDSASYYYEHARTAAHEAENTELGALVLCTMSHLATWRGQPRVGIDHAVAAQGWAAQTNEPRLQAYTADVAARAYAKVGRMIACLRQLESIEGSLTVDEAVGHFDMHFYTKGLFAGTKSLCLLQLRDTDGALTAAQEALTLTDPTFVRNLAFTKLYLGDAYTAAGAVREAAETIGDAAELAVRNPSARLVGQLRAARNRLAAYRIPLVIRGLDERLRTYGLN